MKLEIALDMRRCHPQI